MDTSSQVKVLHLQCEHLRTLLDRVLVELTIMKHELATDGQPSFATIAPHLTGLEKQSEKIAVETLRLQSFCIRWDRQGQTPRLLRASPLSLPLCL
jgi:hypothetical protein